MNSSVQRYIDELTDAPVPAIQKLVLGYAGVSAWSRSSLRESLVEIFQTHAQALDAAVVAWIEEHLMKLPPEKTPTGVWASHLQDLFSALAGLPLPRMRSFGRRRAPHVPAPGSCREAGASPLLLAGRDRVHAGIAASGIAVTIPGLVAVGLGHSLAVLSVPRDHPVTWSLPVASTNRGKEEEMTIIAATIAAGFVLATTSLASAGTVAVKSKTVEYKMGNQTFEGLFVYPQSI